jgi:hypothetical protein
MPEHRRGQERVMHMPARLSLGGGAASHRTCEGTTCEECGTFSISQIDRYIDKELTAKSLEHGHNIDAPELELVDVGREVGIIPEI